MKDDFGSNLFEDDFSNPDFKEGYNIAIRLLSFAPQLSTTLRDKMIKKGINDSIIEKVIDKLKDNQMLDDRKLGIQYVISLSEKCYGKYGAINRLIQKGVDKNEAVDIVDSVYQDDLEVILIEKYLTKNKNSLLKYYKDKKYDYIKKRLYDRGFNSNNINKFFKNGFDNYNMECEE